MAAFIFIVYNLLVPYVTNIPIENYFFIFNIMLLGFFIFSLSSWLGSFLIMTNNLILNIKRVILVLLFSVTTISYMSYRLGIEGAALGVFMSAIFSFLVINYYVKIILRNKL